MSREFRFARIIALLACVLGGYHLTAAPARSDTIKITVGPGASTKAGVINVSWVQGGTPDGNGGITGGTPGSAADPFPDPAGTSAASGANKFAAYFNSTQGAVGTATVTPGVFPPGSSVITITPKDGTPNFTKVKEKGPYGGDGGRLIRATPGRALLDFSPGTGGVTGPVQWTLEVFNQSETLLTSSSVSTAGNSTDASSLLSAFSSSLATAGFPNTVGAEGLAMDTATANWFRISVSDAASLDPQVGMTALPEPGTVVLSVVGAGLLSGRRPTWRRRRRDR